ncbi:MAG: Succinate dehydrogenase hydrophobic membrane anchor subunit [Rhodocyclaceae bacterium]|nr:MAG: succinate dehydrogenase, hydrophobic membrane anchor protein [Rhodocyclaceae bacterium]MBE7421765.1 succinate dehydrogenase, hydrophobic membrane anchor protein [Zoogloeaceae bacterium]MBV6407831.1 Succinate dehydrogenase hydrophobic membrane anchor subunit [Rhodocyclaceae bacterium]MCK6385048.1 succinate dehydrogenase, hydrophobic membrane anchor protein [Rhodocyclaceae bacterium]CAG0931341.1 succinate dehydrogenase / fumarate reductase, membrane anchor subunit [Rhodocyclaceae bacteriu
MVNKIVVGAHYGLKDWLGQRITAAFMAAYTVIFAVLLAGQPDLNYETWRAFMSGGFMRFLTFLFILSLTFHAWVGVRDIWMDYVKPTGLRLALHVLTLLALVGYTGWAVSILWRL